MTSAGKLIMSRAIRDAYRNRKDDETLEPLVLIDTDGKPVGRIKDRDSVIFYNIRGEREIELTRSLTEEGFDKFPVKKGMKLNFATMIEYAKGLNVNVAFPPDGIIKDTLSEVISRHNLRQAKITEAEKSVHIGFFVNGKNDEPLPGEERIIIPTRKDIAFFDDAPEMSIASITESIIEKIHDPDCDFILANFPNVDVVGHIKNEKAIIRAVEAVDIHTGLVIEEAKKTGVTVALTADHGTVEKWFYPDGAIDTGHTTSPVPFILIDKGIVLRKEGELSDIAPTIFQLFNIPKPETMTGHSLIEKYPQSNHSANARRIILLILDGWGINDSPEGNLIARANTHTMDRIMGMYSHTRLKASGEAVGLPEGTVGNSEAGHLHIGAGRRIYSDRIKIDRAISNGSFFNNSAFLRAISAAKDSQTSLHLLGIVSFFSSHGSVDHLLALMDLAKKEGIRNVFIHAMLGRRGEMPESGARYIEQIERKSEEIRLGKVVSIIGRYWSMDREENWDRIEKTYRMLVYGEGTPVRERRE